MSSKELAHPYTSKSFKLFADSCDYASGAILVQEDDVGME